MRSLILQPRARRAGFACIGLLYILAGVIEVAAQYKGSPVQYDRLVKVLRSRSFQTREIVQIIKEQGVDFRLSTKNQSELIAAGARPQVIEAVRRNYRSDIRTAVKGTRPSSASGDYTALVDDAVDAYDIRKDKKTAKSLLERAVGLQPSNPRAYQLLGFLSLYGNKNFDAAEMYWKKAIDLGGSAALRVTHDHSGVFVMSCKGSLFIARDSVRYESDDNNHTFETSDRNIKEIEVTGRFKRLIQLKGGSFRIVLNKNDEESKFVFAPLTGKTDESRMIIRLIGK